jgi:bifunctional DNA-binding transcriptional regulator/antitoxin component of YhaV-PrlF toxin-antitoxin module
MDLLRAALRYHRRPAMAQVKKFTSKLSTEDNALFIEVPFDAKEAFGKAQAPVKVTVNGHTYASTVAVYGGRYYIPVNKENREAAGLNAGDSVDVSLELDTEIRAVEAPADLKAALARSPQARTAWDELSYSHRREHVEALLEAKKPDARARRLKKTVEMLLKQRQKKRAI